MEPVKKTSSKAMHGLGMAMNALMLYSSGSMVAESWRRGEYLGTKTFGAAAHLGLEATWLVPIPTWVGGWIGKAAGGAKWGMAGMIIGGAVQGLGISLAEGLVNTVQKFADKVINRGAQMSGFKTGRVVNNEMVSASIGNAIGRMEEMGMGYQVGIRNRAFFAHKRLSTRL